MKPRSAIFRKHSRRLGRNMMGINWRRQCPKMWDFVNVGGDWLHGRADFKLYHTRLLSGRFRESMAFAALRRAENTGRPVGTAEFVAGLERVLGRRIARRAPGPAPAASVSASQLELLH
jgi:hypothetical protein